MGKASVDVSAEIDIAAAPADVAAVLFDPAREPEWMPAVKSVEVIDPALQPGARVKRTAAIMGRSLVWTTAVESVHFPHVLTLRVIEGPFTGVIAYNVKKHDYRRAIGVLPTSHSEAEAEEAAVPA